ncbi:MAG: hypothetical protein LH632_11245 [Rhodoferax sp.]|nr:hypothetical protein [Rhodoferax sp.]
MSILHDQIIWTERGDGLNGTAEAIEKIRPDGVTVRNNRLTAGRSSAHIKGATTQSHWRRIASIGAISIFCFFSFIGNVISGEKFSDQGNTLTQLMYEELIYKGICSDRQSCFNLLQMYREDGDRIYLNMYTQTNMSLISIVAQFILEKGIKLKRASQ